MAKNFAKEFYRSTAWRKTRAYIFNKQHGVCERCHGKYRTCHALEHEGQLPTAKCLMFDEEGNLVERSIDV